MSAFNADKLGTAEFGRNYKDNFNRFGGAGNAYLGSFQMGRGAWTDSGGSGSDWDTARQQFRSTGKQIKIPYDEQLSRAERYWTLCGMEYLGWNLGRGNMIKLVSNPQATISMLGLCNVVKGQAYARGINCNITTAAQVIQKCEAYYNAGKSGDWVMPDDKGGITVTPGVDKSIGADGTFGGKIELWLKENSVLSDWTTNENENLSQWFLVPCCVALSGTDKFVDHNGITGDLDMDFELGLPYVTCGVTKAYFQPLSQDETYG